ncbi:leucine-rich repeat flightless-interacting protein 1 isoform X50 [Gallus gallus]|uniref:leucine-rich repeat flightless-interacting protein 1 isoform X50 n=1 Tax=Gallus gallus TaxID=9031 RepID=UPI001AE96848|nr:leucine-rich repeat flightless-interacting protein 1 isoform X50 [Gallus gallus]
MSYTNSAWRTPQSTRGRRGEEESVFVAVPLPGKSSSTSLQIQAERALLHVESSQTCPSAHLECCQLYITEGKKKGNSQAEARLAAKRAARAEAREIRMKELERQQKEIYQVQKKYYGLDTKWGDIEQWMEDSERYSRRARRNASASDEDERMSVGSRGSLRSHVEYAGAYPVAGLENERTKWKNYSKATNGYEEDMYGSSQSRKSSRPSLLYSNALPARSYRASVYDESVYSGSRRYSASSSRAPSEYSCYLGSGSRASSRASSARASPVIEERPEKDFEKGARTVSSLSAATLASLGGTSSRRGSGDTSISADTEASIREIKDIYELKEQIQDVEGKYMQGLKEMKDSLAEVEEKYKKAMVSNAQLDNEKTNFMYQVDTLKDALLELEEQLAESRRQYEEKSKEFEREKHAHSILQFQFKEIKEALKQREEMLAEIQQLQQKQQSYVREISDLQETIEWKDKKIGALERQKDFFDSIRSERDDLRDEVIMLKEQLKKHGIIPDSDIATNGEASDVLDNEGHLDSSKTVQGTTQALKTAGDGMLERLKKLIGERESLLDQVKKLKGQLEEKQKNGKLENAQSEVEVLENGTDMHMIDLQRDANRQISDLKFKLAKSEQEITALEQNVIRLEGQVARYKTAAENAERVEDELKAEKRKLQRELRSALDKTEELEVSNGHLVKRLEKMKANRSALLSQQ